MNLSFIPSDSLNMSLYLPLCSVFREYRVLWIPVCGLFLDRLLTLNISSPQIHIQAFFHTLQPRELSHVCDIIAEECGL